MFKDLDLKVDKLETSLVKEAVKVLPFKKGGDVKKTGVYILHKGEKVKPKKKKNKKK